jgi:hypothetical protein
VCEYIISTFRAVRFTNDQRGYIPLHQALQLGRLEGAVQQGMVRL